MNDNADCSSDQHTTPHKAAVGSPPKGTAKNHAARVAAKIATFAPDFLRDEDLSVREAVLSVARPWVIRARPTDEDEVRRLMRPVAALLLNAVRNYDSLDPESILHPDVIECFVMRVCEKRSDVWKGDARWLLERIGRAVVPHLWPMERAKSGKHRVAVPYTFGQEEGFLLGGTRKCRHGRPEEAFIVCGCLALGLSGTEMAAASPGNVVSMGNGRLGLYVTGRNARLVPVREDYTDLMRAAIEAAAGGPFVQSTSHSAVHSVAQRIVVKGHGRLRFARARSTWLMAHLAAGTSLPALRAIAGPLCMNTLTDLVRYASEDMTPESAALEGLRA